jgi:raffinose/stachyose/melibiose transport system substrate-binding protein
MKTKIYPLMTIVIVITMLLGACAPATTTPPEITQAPVSTQASASTQAPVATQGQVATQAPAPTQAPQPTATVQPVKLVYWSYLSETEPLAKILADNVNAWNTANPDIQVEVTWAGRDVLTKLRTALLTGTGPDIVSQSDSELFPSVVKANLGYPLDDALKTPSYDDANVTWMDSFIALQPYSDGHYYLIPDSYYTSGIFYNVTIFNKYSLKPPKTWSQFLSVCKTLKDNGVQPLAVDGAYAFFPGWYFVWLASRIVGDDEFRAAAQDKTGAAWDDPGYLEAAKQVELLVKSGYFQKGYEGTNWPGAETLFSQGNVGMYLTGTWFPAEISDKVGPDFDMAVIPFPSVEGGKGNQTTAEAWSNDWMILNSSKYPEAAIKFLKFMTSKEAMSKFASVETPAPLKDLPLEKWVENQKTILANATKIVPRLDGIQDDNPDWTTKVYWVVDDQLVFGQITAEQFIANLKKAQAAFFSNQ